MHTEQSPEWIDERDSHAAVDAALHRRLPWDDLSPVERRLTVDRLIAESELADTIAARLGTTAADIRQWLSTPPGVAA